MKKNDESWRQRYNPTQLLDEFGMSTSCPPLICRGIN